MKHFYSLTLCALAVIAAIAACKKEDTPGGGTEPVMVNASWTASFEDYQAATKAVLTDGLSVEWTDGDAISVFSNRTNYQIKATSVKGKTATFSGEVAQTDTYLALYPYSEEATSSGDNITAILPEKQQLEKGKADPDAMLAVARASGSDMTFKNMAALVGIKCTGEIESLAIATLSSDDRIAGRVRFNTGTGKATAITGYNRIDFEGTPEDGETYYAAVIPGEFTGLVAIATNSSGLTAELTVESGQLSLERGTVTVFDADFSDVDWILRPPTGQSYTLDGAEDVLEFCEFLPNPKEEVVNLTVKGTDVTDELMAAISGRVSTVQGDLVWENVGATGTAGFFDAIVCQGGITFRDCASLKDLSGLGGITAVGGDLTVENCQALGQGFGALETVSGTLKLQNSSLSIGEGASFGALKSIGGSLLVSDNGENFTSFKGAVLTSVANDISITGNSSLTSLAGIDRLTLIGGDVIITDNGDIPLISDAENVGYCIVREYLNKNTISSTANIRLGSSDALIDISTLPACDGSMPGDPQSYTLVGKAEIEAFVSAGIKDETVKNLTISGDDVDSGTLASVATRVSNVTGTLTLENLTYTSADGWGVGTDNFLEFLTHNGVFEGSIVLKNLGGTANNPNGFVPMTEIKGDLIVENCYGFCMHWGKDSGFGHIQKIGGSMKFINSANEGWYDGNAWASLKEVGGDFVLEGLPHLYYLQGTELTSIGGDLIIRDCPSFWGLNGFDKLSWLGGDVVISNYGKLQIKNGIVDGTDCVGLCMLRDMMDSGKMDPEATVTITNNEEEIPFDSILSCSATYEGDGNGTGEKFDDPEDVTGWK